MFPNSRALTSCVECEYVHLALYLACLNLSICTSTSFDLSSFRASLTNVKWQINAEMKTMKFESSAFRNGYNVSKEAISFLYVDASSQENKNTNFETFIKLTDSTAYAGCRVLYDSKLAYSYGFFRKSYNNYLCVTIKCNLCTIR